MKVFDLCCQQQHRFEGWFASEAAFTDQKARGLIACPICESVEVTRVPSAPRLNLSGASAPPVLPASPSAAAVPAQGGNPADAAAARAMQSALFGAIRQVLAKTENVGERFAEEARRIHYREAPERAIRGVASPQEAAALADEGIEVLSLPVPAALKEPLQ
ncbi:DUF1178 family protein [Chitinasiproducens palmae]|uniref:DUF1178 family protein n=1 Tax=Chitinasiproducens palmae TaxID=1770053 RepID=A0A1H2PUE6_9BURK|nr:DUF1178 family protein [Chitinasiproducens palmae]SDV49992.1 hypothetical protein SAMN05216551_11033 [Chitinasiproducens palmae]